MIKTIRTSILALLVLPVAAQAPGFSVAGGPILGFDSLQKATNNTVGYQLGADYTGHVPGTQIPARAGLAAASFPGKEFNGLKTSLTLGQLHGDLLLPFGACYGIVGGSLNSYTMSRTGTESEDPMDVAHHFPIRDAKGLKLGLRLGLGFNLSKRVALEATFQQTELSGKDLNDEMVRSGGVNPGWLNLDLRFTF